MSEERYEPEDWLELNDLILRMDEDVEEKDFYDLEGQELDMIKRAGEYIKRALNIHTGKMITTSPVTGEKYEVNIWVENWEDGMIRALSKRKIDDES